MKIGILGSSFNPPHIGHLKISEQAIEIFKLDEVWWMITKYNPLKNLDEYLPFEERIEKANSLIRTKTNDYIRIIEEISTNKIVGTGSVYIEFKFAYLFTNFG